MGHQGRDRTFWLVQQRLSGPVCIQKVVDQVEKCERCEWRKTRDELKPIDCKFGAHSYNYGTGLYVISASWEV